MINIYDKRLSSSNSFLITIHHREHHSWQGTIEWLDQRRTQHFRSVLELIKLIDEATVGEKAIEDDSRTWDLEQEAKSS